LKTSKIVVPIVHWTSNKLFNHDFINCSTLLAFVRYIVGMAYVLPYFCYFFLCKCFLGCCISIVILLRCQHSWDISSSWSFQVLLIKIIQYTHTQTCTHTYSLTMCEMISCHMSNTIWFLCVFLKCRNCRR